MKKKKIVPDISAKAYDEQPTDVFELINKYGTYEIQPTADTSNLFPAIAQGIGKVKKDKQKDKSN